MASVVQYGRRRGSRKSVSVAEETSKMIQPPDLQQVTVLTKAEWLRIQDELNRVNKDKESMREAMKEREALHLQSKEVVKLWSNTIAGQRQKKLEAKKIREEIEEEKRKLIDIEEAKYQEEKRKEAIEKAKTQLYYQTDRVKQLHGALLLTEVLKEREAQIKLKQGLKSVSKDLDKQYMETVKTRDDEAERNEKEKIHRKKVERQAVAEDLKNQIKENQLEIEKQKIEIQKDWEDFQSIQELQQRDQKAEEEAQVLQKKNLMQAHLEHIIDRERIKAEDAQKQEAEEDQRKLFLTAKQKMMKLRKDKEKELFREAQMHKESIMVKLKATQQQKTINEEQRIAKAVAEQEARKAQQQWEEEEKRTAMLKSIAAHRENMKQEREQRDKIRQQNERDMLQAKKEADRVFSEKQRLKAQRGKEERKKSQAFNAEQMAEKSARQHRLRREEQEFQAMNTELIAEEEKQFQEYSRSVINAAVGPKKNVFPLCKAAREGIGGGLGPSFGGVRPSYLVQDCTGAQMPKYISDTTQHIKNINEVEDIQEAKRRLGLAWSELS